MNELEVAGKLLNNFKPSYTITVCNADGEVGRLDFSGSNLIFTGDAEESAKIFINNLALSWGKRLQEEREAEREACAKACEKMADNIYSNSHEDSQPMPHAVAKFCAAAIRARGEQEQTR